MKPSLQQKLEQDPKQSIDLSPLIDVVFILLIFFIVTTAFIKETGIKVEKPKAVMAQKLENELILVAITPAGEVIYDHTNIGVSGVRSTVSALMMIKERN